MNSAALRTVELFLWAVAAAAAMPALAGAMDLWGWMMLGGQVTDIVWTDARQMVAVVCAMVFAPASTFVAAAFTEALR